MKRILYVLRYLLILTLTVLCFSCDKQSDWMLSIPTFNETALIGQSAPLSVETKTSIEGVYKVIKGYNAFGDTLVLKSTKDKISFFGEKNGTFFITDIGLYDNSVMMEGYWRHILSDETGLIRLFASNTDSILYQGDLVKSIILTGLYGNGSSNINQPIELQRVERFSEDLLNDDFRIIAHRGGGRTSDRLPFSENSIEMINYSQNLGATAIEIDVFLTKDSVPILIHDSELSLRLIQKSPLFGNISNYTYEQLHTYVKLIHGEEIPTLDDALHYVVYNTALSLVWLDIKDSESIRKVLPIQQTYLREAFELGRELQILIGVPDNNVYDALLSIPDYNQIPSLCELEPNIAIKAGSKAWGFRYTQGYQNQNVLVMHQAGLLCIPWTIDIPQYINEYISRGGSNSLLRYDGILTNYPTILAYYHYVRHN